MEKKIKIEGLDCASCALELEDEIKKIKHVNDCKVDFVKQTVKVNFDGKIDDIYQKINTFEKCKVINGNDISFKVCNIDCASCALELEEELLKIEGVEKAMVDFLKQEIKLTLSDVASIDKIKSHINSFEEVKIVETEPKNNKLDGKKKDLILIIVSACFFILGLIFEHTLDENLWYISMISYLLTFIIVGYPVLINTVKNVSKGHIFDENFLMTIAAIGAMGIEQFSEGAAVMLLYQIGELLQNIAVNSSRKEITSLMDLKSNYANKVEDDKVIKVTPEELNIGDIILIKNGEKVPTDCLLVDGESVFDTKSLTGEALPRESKVGDQILGGFVNNGKVVKGKVTHLYQDSSVAKILSLIEDSSSVKAEPEKFITKFSKYYTPIVCIIALIIGLIVPLIVSLIQGGNYSENYLDYLYRAMTLLVISCPCALIISVPLTYFNGIGVSAKNGILIKGATYLDILNKADIYAFDKTGTLTKGIFTIINTSLSNDKLSIIASLEKNSNHPLARAFDQYFNNIIVNDVEEISGKGLKGKYQNDIYLVGNEKLMKDVEGFIKRESYSTIVYAAKNNQYLGYCEIDDEIKKEAKSVMDNLKTLGIKKLVMLTGDNLSRGEIVAKELHLDEVKGDLLPEDKLSVAKKLNSEGTLLYVGDGINDAPVMMEAKVSVSMGKLGSDAAIEQSDIVLVSDDLNGLVKSKKIARKTHNIVFQNIIGSIFLKVIFMILGVMSLIPLAAAVFADVGVMLLAIINSLRMRIKIK